MTDEVETHPIQTHALYGREKARLPTTVTLRAYEVYVALFREQPALITGECRGGFGVGEIIAFLYARGFPRQEWYDRFREALKGARGL